MYIIRRATFLRCFNASDCLEHLKKNCVWLLFVICLKCADVFSSNIFQQKTKAFPFQKNPKCSQKNPDVFKNISGSKKCSQNPKIVGSKMFPKKLKIYPKLSPPPKKKILKVTREMAFTKA